MRKIVSVATALFASLTASGAESKYPAATVDVPGAWEKDQESTVDELTLNSKPEGQQIIVSVLRVKKELTDLDQVADIAAKIYEMRVKAFLTLSKGTAKFDKPESAATETSVVCVCRGYVEKDKVRMAVRVEATSKIVRSTSVYDYTGQSAEEFQKWSTAILAGVK